MLRTLFIAAILVPGVVLALRSRYAALILYLWFALFRPQDWLWIDITSLRISLLLGLLMIVPGVITGALPNVTHPLSVAMIGFFMSALVSQAHAVDAAVGWVWIDFLIRLLLTSLMVVTLANTSRRLVGVVAVIAGSLGFHAAKAGLAYLVAGGTRFADGLAGAFVDNNGYALATVMIMPLLLVAAQNVTLVYNGRLLRLVRSGIYAAAFFCAFAIVGTYSRGGFLSLAAAALTYVLLQRRRMTTLVVAGAAVALFIALVPIPRSYIDRLETIQTYEEVGDDSALSRPHFWNVGMEMVAANPFGIGLKQYEIAYDRYDSTRGRFGHNRAVHSSHIQVLAETGYLGAAFWAAMFMFALWACFRVRARSKTEGLAPETARFLFTTANGLLVSMVAFLVGGSFLSLALNDLTWLTFGIVAALDRVSRDVCAEAASPVEAASPEPPPVLEPPSALRPVPKYLLARGRYS